MHADKAVRWTAPGEAVLYWESWGEQHALFDLRSAETHLLADPTARVLQQLARCPATVRDVAESLCVASDQVCDEQFLEYATRLFLQLQNVGLIEKADT
jgi:PqqD family protein of HPr-rel-A system